ncbi:uncharacterized protein NECHADRAFT_44490 [Fusarium vanettenii 77-13-4]|uniref:Uncharacterized protein n=1 Tax=Fusarium vanettenii (strain ATCC MYA-4622 / CBS 123669 / FGSC 9596 / NRRL 45880 / 77-13-4) TaxID=660122 RepID=C7ZNE5_FUSV7|nr:uncharacterized protein NECHADRAFT_44490 [Fusarium vanettenii 77-13-4]EEU34445.1 hypothetical protein NECHADRAFT_44490 [Fusarium vanettenii 77-13-4]
MPFSMADLNKRDETASKIPAPAKGFGALFGGGGYAEVVCCPLSVIFWSGYAITKKIKKKRQEKKATAAEAEEEVAVGSSDRTNHKDAEKMAEGSRASHVSPTPSPGEVSGTAPLDPALQKHPNNPRVCDPECPGYGKDFCLAHQRKGTSRPTSPGLLAV